MSQAIENRLDNAYLIADCIVKVSGQNVSNEIMDKVMLVEVQQNLYLPAMFTIHIYSPDLELFETNPFSMGAEVSIYMSQDNSSQKILVGEITTVEIDADVGTPLLIIRGYDRLHRLQRGRKTRTFAQVKDSDLVTKLASEGGLSASVATTSGVYEYLLQNNETNLEFLQRRVHRLGMEMFAEDKTLKLRKTSSDPEVATLNWGENLIRFVSRLTSVNQVASVEVIGWDAKTKNTIVGTSSTSNNHPQTGEGSRSKSYASTFGTAKVASVYRPVTTQSEASDVAQAIYDDLIGRFIQAEGSCLGDTRLQPGKWIKVDKIGQKYGGKFYLTGCTHRYTPKGYLTEFEATGRQTNSWLELNNQQGERGGGNEAVNSVVIGIVTNNKDPENMGRVKVKFPWLPTNEGAGIESTWARLVSPMAGAGRGFMFLPEVNDEVLLGFERGDVQHPFVIGELWNGKDAPPLNANQIVGGDGKVKQRILKTTSGHTLTFDDSDDAPKITIIDKTNNNKITIDSVTNLITIETKSGDITLESKQGNVNLKAAAGKISLDAKEVEIKSATSGKVEAATLEIKANASAKLNAAIIEIAASSTAKLDGGGMLEVKGGLVKIN